MAGMFDVAKELARLGKQKLKLEKELTGVNAKLNNPKFVANAKEAIVAGIRKQAGELDEKMAQVEREMVTVSSLGSS